MKVVMNKGQSSTDCPFCDDRFVGGIACVRCQHFNGIKIVSRHGDLAIWDVDCCEENRRGPVLSSLGRKYPRRDNV
jgi:hypothetical protein